MLACLSLQLGVFRLRTVSVLNMPGAEAASTVERAEPQTSRGRLLYKKRCKWFEIFKTAACPKPKGSDQRRITFSKRTASRLWSEDKKMTRFSVIFIAVATCALAGSMFGQHHKSPKQTDSAAVVSGPLTSATVSFGAFMSQPHT